MTDIVDSAEDIALGVAQQVHSVPASVLGVVEQLAPKLAVLQMAVRAASHQNADPQRVVEYMKLRRVSRKLLDSVSVAAAAMLDAEKASQLLVTELSAVIERRGKDGAADGEKN